MRYQLKPKGSFEVRQVTTDNINDVANWCKGTVGAYDNIPAIRVCTVIGIHIALPGNWILKGIGGYYDVYDDATFHDRYEPVPVGKEGK